MRRNVFALLKRSSANQWRAEALGCPGPTRFLDALKLFFLQNISIRLSKFLTTVITFHANLVLGCPSPILLHNASVTTFCYSFISHLSTFFMKTDPWMPPRVDARGCCTVRAPLCTLLLPISLILRFLGWHIQHWHLRRHLY